jgi:15-cis-phytoene synthase
VLEKRNVGEMPGKERRVPPQPPRTMNLTVQSNSGYAAQPLPADEQLALLFRLANTQECPLPPDTAPEQPPDVKHAYAACQRNIRHHSKTFFFSTNFLPPEQRRAVHALYAFCRTTDDTVDMARDNPVQALADWVQQVHRPLPPPDNPVLVAWADTRSRYNIPCDLIDELLAGVAMDLTISRYATFADLWLYCYRVASVVGLLSMCILGSAPGAEPYAIKLGVALQLTNVLRDVGEDANRGRVYLPQDDIEHFGLSPDDILQGRRDERFRALMQFEIARAHRLYDESWYGIALLPPEVRLGVGAAARVYRGILDKVVSNDYDVFNRRAYLTRTEKLLLLPRIWRDVRRVGRSC